MQTRIVHTKFYSSERILSLSANARWLFMYFITCDGIGLTGAFKRAQSKISFETGLTKKQITDSKEELQASKLVFFDGDWIVVSEVDEKTKYSKGLKTSVGYTKELESLPENIQNLIQYQYSIENDDRVSIVVDTPINHKSENRNHKPSLESVENLSLEAKSYSSLSEVGEQEIRDIADGYQVPESFVLSKLEDLENYCSGNGKRYKNYLATLKQWVKKDALSVRKEHSGRSKIAFINE